MTDDEEVARYLAEAIQKKLDGDIWSGVTCTTGGYSTADVTIESMLEVAKRTAEARQEWIRSFAKATADIKCPLCGRGVTLFSALGDTVGVCEHLYGIMRTALRGTYGESDPRSAFDLRVEVVD